jgi:hypothetical protein
VKGVRKHRCNPEYRSESEHQKVPTVAKLTTHIAAHEDNEDPSTNFGVHTLSPSKFCQFSRFVFGCVHLAAFLLSSTCLSTKGSPPQPAPTNHHLPLEFAERRSSSDTRSGSCARTEDDLF